MLTRAGTLVSCSHDQVPSQPLPESYFLKHKDISLTITVYILVTLAAWVHQFGPD